MGAAAEAAPVQPPHRIVRHHHGVPWQFFGYPHIRRFPPPREPKLFFPPPETEIPPPVEATPPPGEEPVEPGPLPHGFVLTEAVSGGGRPTVPSTLTRFRDVGSALAACWTPPASLAWGSITLRVAFTRDGDVYGLPRIPYVDAPTGDARAELTRSLSAALKSCTPLPLSHRLGAAVAGEIFAIRFVNQGAHDDRH
ncbi:MAG TPA: hypothetical protein VH414_09075 [Lichenihabitans sp.]|jgi:hypothetical protein|nr:hypothetical protein [Lichenihabitans sp.]